MAAPCEVVPQAGSFASTMLAFVDCEARTLGAGGYQALAAGGSTAAALLATLLTLFVALWGYRLVLGDRPAWGEVIVAAVKVGIVLMLATAWPAYQTLIYDVVLRTPAELAGEIGAPQSLPGSAGALPARLDAVDAAFQRLAIAGTGQPRTPEEQAFFRSNVPPPLFINFDTFALGMARLTYLAGTLGGFALLRLGAGILLALGPLFAMFLLFAGTRGLFEGWLRALIGTILGTLALTLVLGIELVLLEPWLGELLARRAAQAPIPGVPAELLVATAVFAVASVGLAVLALRVASGLSLPAWSWQRRPVRTAGSDRARYVERSRGDRIERNEDRSRAQLVADAIGIAQRREFAGAAGGAASRLLTADTVGRASRSNDAMTTVPLGRSYRKRIGTRRSASAARRDRGS